MLGATSGLIEKLSTSVLKSVAGRGASVSCQVQATAGELFRGKLKEAIVSGTSWSTPAGMTMRSIDLTLDGFSIKIEDVLKGRITFKVPATGKAVLVLNGKDFSNFLVHPLLRKAPLPCGDFTFLREYSTVDYENEVIYFSGLWHGQHIIMEASQPERFGTIYVRVADAPKLTSLGIETLSKELSHFFNSVRLEMDGTELSFTDMKIGLGEQGEPIVRVTVDLEVHRVPNPANMQF
jgi:hypothetical protein